MVRVVRLGADQPSRLFSKDEGVVVNNREHINQVGSIELSKHHLAHHLVVKHCLSYFFEGFRCASMPSSLGRDSKRAVLLKSSCADAKLKTSHSDGLAVCHSFLKFGDVSFAPKDGG